MLAKAPRHDSRITADARCVLGAVTWLDARLIRATTLGLLSLQSTVLKIEVFIKLAIASTNPLLRPSIAGLRDIAINIRCI